MKNKNGNGVRHAKWLFDSISWFVFIICIFFFAQIFVVYFTEPDMFYETAEYNKRKIEVKNTKLTIFNVVEKMYYR